MKYGITVCTLDNWPIIEISEADFDALRDAKSNLLTVLGIEEKFDALLQNYSEYEREMYDIVLDHMVHQGDWEWSVVVADIFRLNRRLVNLLATTRLYTDQVQHDLATLFTSVPVTASGCFSAEYDTVFAYRFMEALRNHVQHRGLPISKATYPSAWEERDGKPRMALRFGITAQVDVQELRENPKFKPSVLAELAQHTEPVDITILVRKYVESFNRIHEIVRNALAPSISGWTATFMDAFGRSQAQLGDRKHVDVVKWDDDDKKCEQIAIVRDLLARINELKHRNEPLLKTLAQWHISTEVS